MKPGWGAGLPPLGVQGKTLIFNIKYLPKASHVYYLLLYYILYYTILYYTVRRWLVVGIPSATPYWWAPDEADCGTDGQAFEIRRSVGFGGAPST